MKKNLAKHGKTWLFMFNLAQFGTTWLFRFKLAKTNKNWLNMAIQVKLG